MRNQENITGLALAPYLRNVNIQWDHVNISDILEMDFDPAERRKYALTDGDLLVCEGGEVGRTAIWRGELAECYIQNAVHRVRPLTSKEEGRFLFYVFYAVANLGVFEAEVNRSTIGHLTSEKLKKYRFMFPPLKEQRTIATFLDREAARINSLIAKKERLIELLQEKRAALISHAVTRGLDPTVPVKDSGVEWLGEIPAHWDVKRLKFAASFFGGGTPFKENIEYWSGDIPWVSPKDMKAEIIRDTEEHITKGAIDDSSTRLVLPGTVLIVVRSGVLRHSIPVAINVRPMALNQDMKAIVPKPFLKPEYLAFVIRGHQGALLVEWRKEGATVESIEYELLVNTSCPIPPLSEQHAIATYLDSKTAKIDALISRIREGIEKLKEYSSALISAAVMGKIDMRGAIASQDDEHL